MNEKVAIWGTGTLAEKFYYLCKDKFDIICFYDNDEKKHNTTLFGIPIKKWTISNEHKIIIASMYWREITNQLIESGLCIENDFEIYSKYLGIGGQNYSEIYYLTDKNLKNSAKEILLPQKKIAVVYGNCQTTLIENAMRQHSAFSKEYTVISIPKVCEYVNNKELLEYFIHDEVFWKQIDLFIYQTVSTDNKFSEILSTDGILHKLRQDCKTVNIVNVYFDSYFPQRTENKHPILKEIHQSGLFPFGDKYVDAMLQENYSVEKIISTITKEDFISETEIMNGVSKSLDELKARETTVDVKVSDFIEKHYKEEQLFYSPNHPCERLMKVYIDRILEFLGYEPEEMSDADMILNFGTLKGQDIPIYPAVKKVLGLKKYERKYYPNRYLCEEVLFDFREFVMQYIVSVT